MLTTGVSFADTVLTVAKGFHGVMNNQALRSNDHAESKPKARGSADQSERASAPRRHTAEAAGIIGRGVATPLVRSPTTAGMKEALSDA